MAIKEWNNLRIDYPTQDVKGYEEIINKFSEYKISIDIRVNNEIFYSIKNNSKGKITFTTTSTELSDTMVMKTIIQYFEWLSNHRKNLNLLKENGYY
ncbi:hypothetical protein [Sporocytophaga myxococcoides]|uniref:hypothetical protein n=1 Tax=Sporocytophaga myxococcoides TaxID=153721 RepID=UPI00041A8053|nr:hypothetical protein [Sporocytophaga myxococcoides]